MVVAASAANGQPQPYGAGRIDAVHHVFNLVLLGNDAAFRVAAMVAVETGRDSLLQRGVRQQIARQLFDGKAVERQIGVEGVDDPISPPPHIAGAVVLIAARIGVTRSVEPIGSHPLPVAGRVEQAVNQALIGLGRIIAQKGVDFRQRRRKARQVQRQTADERRFVGFWRRAQALGLEPGENEIVDRVARPAGIVNRRRLRPRLGNQRPVLRPLGAFGDPTPQPLDLLGREFAAGTDRRHF